jgi:glycyl-tRNA synthetase beta subunit
MKSAVGPSATRQRVVTVDRAPALRNARLRLMKRLEHLILQLGDISEIVAVES